MDSAHGRAVNHVMQQRQMTTATSNHNLPSCIIASTVTSILSTYNCPLSSSLTLKLWPTVNPSLKEPTRSLFGRGQSLQAWLWMLWCWESWRLQLDAVAKFTWVHMKHHEPQQHLLQDRVSQISIHTCLQMFSPKLSSTDQIHVSDEEKGRLPEED